MMVEAGRWFAFIRLKLDFVRKNKSATVPCIDDAERPETWV
jgi:hypothetical protein